MKDYLIAHKDNYEALTECKNQLRQMVDECDLRLKYLNNVDSMVDYYLNIHKDLNSLKSLYAFIHREDKRLLNTESSTV